jgi:hypothetical protein
MWVLIRPHDSEEPGHANDHDNRSRHREVGFPGSLTTTPLPSTWLMLLSGFLGLGFFAYRGINKSVVAVATA